MRPKKRLGQHFLQDRSCARRIVNYLEIVDGDVVLEIGSGRGILTDCLMESPASEIIGVEVDPHLAVLLQHQYRQDHRFRLINEDFLKLGWDQLSSVRKIKVIGNLPYYITSPILFQLLSKRDRVERCVITVQKEVGDRLKSTHGSKIYGIPSVLFQLYGSVEKLFILSRYVFSPQPEVDSMVIKIIFFNQPRYPISNNEFFKDMLKSVFGQRRKMLRNTLKNIVNEPSLLDGLSFDLSKRPESLSVVELAQLSNALFPLRKG